MRINEPVRLRSGFTLSDRRESKGEIYFHVPYRLLLGNLTLIAQNRVNCEIYVDSISLDTLTEKELSLINDTFKKNGLLKNLHGPFFDLNSGSFDEKIREASQRRYIETLELCRKLGINNVVMHTGFHPIFYTHVRERWLGFAEMCWKPVAEKAQRYGITICVENSIDRSPDVIVELIKRVNSPNFLACFDVAHYNVFGELGIFESLKRYPPSIIGEIHLSDNDGSADSHLALGEGKIDFAAFFKEIDKLGISPIITIEPHTPADIPKGLAYLKKLNLL